MMGDSSKLLTHYHDDARTLYEVFQRGLHISGGCGVGYSLTYTHKHVFCHTRACKQHQLSTNGFILHFLKRQIAFILILL